MEVGRFIRNTALYLGCFVLLNVIIVLLLGRLMGTASLRLPEHITTLIIGDSQVECALNDTLLPHSVNLAMGGEAFLYSHIKVRALLDQNPQLDTVWLSYNFRSLEKRQDTLTRSERYNKYKLPYHFFMLHLEDLHIFGTQPTFYTALIRAPYSRRNLVKKYMHRPLTLQDLNIGSYQYLKRDKLHTDVAKRDSLYNANATPLPRFGDAVDQIEYLSKLVSLCREKKVALILVNTPVNGVVARDSDTTAYYAYWRKHLSGIPLWDHSAWTLPDTCFGDATHLNYKGAKLYSDRLRALRSNGWHGVDECMWNGTPTVVPITGVAPL